MVSNSRGLSMFYCTAKPVTNFTENLLPRVFGLEVLSQTQMLRGRKTYFVCNRHLT